MELASGSYRDHTVRGGSPYAHFIIVFQRITNLPPDQGRGPGEPAAERGQTKYVIFFDSSFFPGFAHGNWDGGGRCIAQAHNIVIDLVIPQGQLLLNISLILRLAWWGTSKLMSSFFRLFLS